jgi:hypothetical protein
MFIPGILMFPPHISIYYVQSGIVMLPSCIHTYPLSAYIALDGR